MDHSAPAGQGGPDLGRSGAVIAEPGAGRGGRGGRGGGSDPGIAGSSVSYRSAGMAEDKVADVERDLIRTRTAEGRNRAKARGQHMGRPPKLTPQQQKEARRRCDNGEPIGDIARTFNVHNSTISRLSA